MVKLIIFDFDGVIITGSNEGYFKCYHKALEAVNVHLDPVEERRRILEIWGKGYVFQLEYLLKEHPELLPKAIKVYESCYHSPTFSENIRLIKGAEISLRQLAKKYSLAIAAGMMRKTLDRLLKKFEIAKLFQEIMTSDEIANPEDKKPAPFMLNQIVSKFSLDKDEVVYVGDAEGDVRMARNAGLVPIVVLTGHLTRKEAEDLKVRHIISDVTRLPEVLN